MQTASTCRLKGQLRHTTAFTSTNRPRTSRISRSICTRAALDGPAIYAVTQQTIAYGRFQCTFKVNTVDQQPTLHHMLSIFAITHFFTAAVVGAEAAFTGLNTKSDTPGRPAIPSTLAITGGTVVVRTALYFVLNPIIYHKGY